ncbi:protein FAM3C isoform X2 [Clupea harengus]|uniref:Protein FAM3C isoform X2 n=1 Tax=Clupea harengus TaxID=7950 RepID=A0A6P8FD35_CLUHA|nr:protein FAM3C isoform X2 [Clupea harengus]
MGMWNSRKGQNRCGLMKELTQIKNGVLYLWIALATIVLIWMAVSYHSVAGTKLDSLLGETKRGVETIQTRSMTKPLNFKCGIKACPDDHFTFHLKSGVANILGPRICFEGETLVSGVKNNIVVGLNIALLRGDTGEIVKTAAFDMYAGKVEPVVEFLKAIKPNTIVLVASYDEPAWIMTSEIRELFSNLGSSEILTLASRDSWVFAGVSGIIGKSPYERVIKNDVNTNMYAGWPGTVALGGCFPKTTHQNDMNQEHHLKQQMSNSSKAHSS